MNDTNSPRQSEPDYQSLDAFIDVEKETGWSREDIRSLGFLLGGFAIILAIVSLGLLLG